MSPRVRRLLARAGLVLGGVAVALLVAEGVGRMLDLATGADLVFMAPQSYPQDIYVKDGEMAYPNPRFAGTVASYGYATQPRFSRWGTRGPEPTPGVPTWIGLGDSFTIALQVEEDETFLARAAAAAGVQAINAGVDGYSTWQAGLRAVQLGRNFPPSLVILAFFTGNDFQDNTRQPGGRSIEQPGLGPGEAGAPEYKVPSMGFVPEHRSPMKWIRDRSVLVAAWDVRSKTRQMRNPRDPAAGRFRGELGIFTVEGRANLDRDLPQTRAALQRFRDAAARVRAANLVVVIPPAFAMDVETASKTFTSVGLTATPDLDAAQDAAVKAAREAGLRVCDVMPVLREAQSAGQKPYLAFDGHLSRTGHEVVASAIGRCLAEPGAGAGG